MPSLYHFQQTAVAQLLSGKHIIVAGCGCLAQGTPVKMADGSIKKVENVQAGDKLISFDDESGKIIPNEVASVIRSCVCPKPMIELEYDGERITTTYDHYFYTGDGFAPLYQLIWGALETSQRSELQLLCKQYGQDCDDTFFWKKYSKDNVARKGQIRILQDSDGWKNCESPQDYSGNLVRKSFESTISKSHRLQSEQQQNRESRMVLSKIQCLLWGSQWEHKSSDHINKPQESIRSSRAGGDKKVLLGQYAKHDEPGENPRVREVVQEVQESVKAANCKVRNWSIKIKGAAPYYTISMRTAPYSYCIGERHTYITHNSGKNPMSMVWASEKCKETGKSNVLVVTTASKAKTCFVAGTKVLTSSGEKNIEDVELGERVLSYKDGKVIKRRVIDCVKQETTKALYRIDFGGSCNIIGTEDHPFYVGGGVYKEMKDIQKGDIIYGIRSETKRSTKKTQRGDGEILQSEPEPCVLSMPKVDARTDEGATRPVVETRNANLLRKMSSSSQEKREKERIQEKTSIKIPKWCAMLNVRNSDRLRRNEEDAEVKILQNGEDILFHGLCEKSSNYGSGKIKDGYDSQAKTSSGKDKGKGFCGEKYSHERKTVPDTAVSGRRIRVCGRFRGHLCADRYSVPERQDWDRDRRITSWKPAPAESRCAERQEIIPIRVENIQVLGQGANRENIVYCITVEDSHNFFANGVLVHNCDHWDDMYSFCPLFSKSLSSFSLLSWHKLATWVNANWDSLGDYVVVFDEIQRCSAGVSSGMGRAFLKLTKRNPDWAGFTGTPGDTWLKFYPYFQACDLVRNKTMFLNTYANVQTYKGYPEIVGWRNEDKLKRMWSAISFAPDTSKVMAELPEQTHKVFTFKKPTSYNKVVKTRLNEDGEFLDTAGALCAELRRQCFTKDKQEWIKDFVTDLESGCVFFYNFIKTGDELEKIMTKTLPKGAKVWRIDGKHHDIPTAETIGPNDMVLCQWQSGSEALNLQFLHYWVAVELCYSYSTANQARGRIRRLGQKHPQWYGYLLTEGTIEQDILQCLKGKSEFSEKVWCASNNIEVKEKK